MNPLVSIIIVTYNNEKYIKNSIISLVEQSYDNIEIIILDNNSTDNTIYILQELTNKYTNIKIIINNEYKDPYICKNIGYNYINKNTSYVMFYECYDILFLNKIKVLVDFLENNIEYSLVSSRVNYVDINNNNVTLNASNENDFINNIDLDTTLIRKEALYSFLTFNKINTTNFINDIVTHDYKIKNIEEILGTKILIPEIINSINEENNTQIETSKNIGDYMNIPNNLCVLPWIHISTAIGKYSACCINRIIYGDMKNMSLDEVWNGDEIKKLRLKFLNNEKPSGCEMCFEKENKNIKSWRNLQNGMHLNTFKHIIDDTDKTGMLPPNHKIKYLDLRFDNICNCKCRMCGHHSSYRWFDEAKTLNLETYSDVAVMNHFSTKEDLINKLGSQLSQVNMILFGGGDPILSPMNVILLKYLVEIGNLNVHLNYTTNLLHLNYEFLDLIKQFKNVNILISIDGYSREHDYIRGHDGAFEKVIKNINILKEKCPEIETKIIPCLSIYNAYTMPHLIEYLLDNKIVRDKTLIYIGIVSDMKCLRPQLLNDCLKEMAISRWNELIKKYGEYQPFRDCINSILIKEDDNRLDILKEFFKYTNDLDKLRNVHVFDVFPELRILEEDLM